MPNVLRTKRFLWCAIKRARTSAHGSGSGIGPASVAHGKALAQAMGDKDATLASGSAPIRAGLSHRDLLEHRRQAPGSRYRGSSDAEVDEDLERRFLEPSSPWQREDETPLSGWPTTSVPLP